MAAATAVLTSLEAEERWRAAGAAFGEGDTDDSASDATSYDDYELLDDAAVRGLAADLVTVGRAAAAAGDDLGDGGEVVAKGVCLQAKLEAADAAGKRLVVELKADDAAADALTVLRGAVSASVVYAACATLCNLAAASAVTRKALARQGAEPAVVAAMCAHPSNAGVACEGCRALRNLALQAEECMSLRADGAVDAIVAALRAHAGDAGVAVVGCKALGALAADELDAAFALCRAGGDAAILAALGVHTDTVEVVLAGCRALQMMAKAEEVSVALVTHGVATSVLAVLRAHPDSAAIVVAACSLLDRIGRAACAGDWLLRTGAADVVLAALRAHIGNAAAVAATCRLLASPALGYDVALPRHRDSAQAAVATALAVHPGNAEVAVVGCSALVRLVNLSDVGCSLGGAMAVVAAMRSHADNADVVPAVCAFVQSLASDEASCAVLVEAGAVSQLANALWRHAGTLTVVQTACRAMSALAAAPETAQRPAFHGAIPALVAARAAHATDPVIHSAVASTLLAIQPSGPVSAAVEARPHGGAGRAAAGHAAGVDKLRAALSAFQGLWL